VQAADDLEVAKAQLNLDQSELSDSLEDLARESGDQRGKIQQELAAREAEMKEYDAQVAAGDGQAAVVSSGEYSTLASQIAAWWAQRIRMQLIKQAEGLARADVAALTEDHKRLEAEALESSEAGVKAAGAQSSGAGRVKELQRMATQRYVLSVVDDRLVAQQQLVALYGKWHDQVELQHKMVIHLMLQSLGWIAGIVLLMLLVGWGLQVMLERMSQDIRQRRTMRTVSIFFRLCCINGRV
jgi:hypothetical protein